MLRDEAEPTAVAALAGLDGDNFSVFSVRLYSYIFIKRTYLGIVESHPELVLC